MLRYLIAAIILTIPAGVQAHPGHRYNSDGECIVIGNETGRPCSIVKTPRNFVLIDGVNTWSYTEQFNMMFGSYYSVHLNGELAGNDICWESSRGVHCRGFNFIYGN
jgi:hypothetical protein